MTAQHRVLAAMANGDPIKKIASGYFVNGTKVARSMIYSLVTDMLVTPIPDGYVLSDRGTETLRKLFHVPQMEMLMASYRYCNNTHGVDYSGIRPMITADRNHIPTIEGYQAGDKLTLAYEGTVLATPDAKGCEVLFRLFNAPWERPDEYAGPSMSIGDVVTFYVGRPDEISFACAMTGFVKVDIHKSQITVRPSKWIRTEKELADYRDAKADEGY